jgi:hypothetical protein
MIFRAAYLKSTGVPTETHEVKKELDRVKGYMKKLKTAEQEQKGIVDCQYLSVVTSVSGSCIHGSVFRSSISRIYLFLIPQRLHQSHISTAARPSDLFDTPSTPRARRVPPLMQLPAATQVRTRPRSKMLLSHLLI